MKTLHFPNENQLIVVLSVSGNVSEAMQVIDLVCYLNC